MKDYTKSFADMRPSVQDAAGRSTSVNDLNIFLPKSIYEALPAAYMSAGSLLILGAVYIGISHGTVVGYLAVGLSCMFAGVAVARIRRKERSK